MRDCRLIGGVVYGCTTTSNSSSLLSGRRLVAVCTHDKEQLLLLSSAIQIMFERMSWEAKNSSNHIIVVLRINYKNRTIYIIILYYYYV